MTTVLAVEDDPAIDGPADSVRLYTSLTGKIGSRVVITITAFS
jgi:hypothetical protein